MAGTHQIWKLDLAKHTVAPFAGTGAEARNDGKIDEAAFAQPSGIASDGKNLFVSDAESNVIRKIDLQKQTVETLAGGDLYVFGDTDGAGDDVRFQHPLGVALDGDKVLIADTYNHKIKLLDAAKKSVETFSGDGKSGQADGKSPSFYEPAGLSVAGDKLFVADTNNQAVRVIDLKTKTVSTLKIENLTPPASAKTETSGFSPNLKEIKTETKEISAGSSNSLDFQIVLPAGFHVNPNAPNRFEVSTSGAENLKFGSIAQKFTKLPLSIPFESLSAGATVLKAKLTVYYCREDNTGACLIKTLHWQIPVKITANKNVPGKIQLAETLTADN